VVPDEAPRAGHLSRTVRRRSPHSPAALQARLEQAVEPLEGGFTLVSRLSGGGIVTRTLRAPDTDRMLFGRVTAARIRVALVHRGIDTSPFQPIVSVGLVADGEGSRVELELAPHPNARTLGGVFALGAVLLLGASLLQLVAQPVVALTGVVFAMVLGGFPHLRARHGFRRDAEAVVQALGSLLELEP